MAKLLNLLTWNQFNYTTFTTNRSVTSTYFGNWNMFYFFNINWKWISCMAYLLNGAHVKKKPKKNQKKNNNDQIGTGSSSTAVQKHSGTHHPEAIDTHTRTHTQWKWTDPQENPPMNWLIWIETVAKEDRCQQRVSQRQPLTTRAGRWMYKKKKSTTTGASLSLSLSCEPLSSSSSPCPPPPRPPPSWAPPPSYLYTTRNAALRIRWLRLFLASLSLSLSIYFYLMLARIIINELFIRWLQ